MCTGNKHIFFFCVPFDAKADTRAGLYTRHASPHTVIAHLVFGMTNIAGTRHLCVCLWVCVDSGQWTPRVSPNA